MHQTRTRASGSDF
ncbi:unnamed protein product, partial [Rotaria magnacalcarata]